MSWRLRQLARRIEQGALIACSTDSIWGFSCHPLRIAAVRRLLQLKQRPLSKGLILLGSDLQQFRPYLAVATLEPPSPTARPGCRPTAAVSRSA